MSAPVKIEVVEAMSEKAYSAATLCTNKAAYGDRRDLVFREVPDALLGQTFVLGADRCQYLYFGTCVTSTIVQKYKY